MTTILIVLKIVKVIVTNFDFNFNSKTVDGDYDFDCFKNS